MIEIRVPGQQLESMGEVEEPLALGVAVEVKAAVRVASVARGGRAVTIKAQEDDVVELQMEGGGTLWLRADELAERQGTPARGGVGGVVDLGAALPLDDAARGIGSWAIQVLRVLGFNLAEKSARTLALALEKKAVAEPGLWRWDGGDSLKPFDKAKLPPGDDPWLLFIHGTASSTRGSFGGLASAQPGRWQELAKRYGERILAFEHHTLTQSPIENALALVEALPIGIELHVVSHSRGGLVGELLSRGRITDADGNARAAFDEPELALFAGEGFEAQREQLLDLGRALALRRPKLTRFVRVACPACGTSLMSERLDRWLNLFFNVTRLVTGGRLNPIAAELLDALRALVQATVKERSKPDSLPGLAAMAPDHSPLLTMLNREDARLQDELCIIAGDSEPADLLRRLAMWFADLYFGGDHDLVVDTASMAGGSPRAVPPRVFREQAPHVNHFSYFANPRSAEILARALTEPELSDEIGEELVRAALEPMPELTPPRGTGKVPIVFVLPGINGTHLKVGDKRIWIDIGALAFGGVGKLAIDNSRVEPDEPVARYYGELCRLLSATHEVRPWGYDWRRSIIETAGRLARDLHAALDATEGAVRIVAHSMGGLVARAALALDADLQRRFKERRGSRLVMLGTPNGGSHSIPMLLLGRNRLMRYLAGLDLRASAADHLKVVSRWPGALQMLPKDEASPLFTLDGWKKLAARDPDAPWSPPTAEALAEARRFRDLIDEAPLDLERMLYIAGQGPTPAGIVPNGDGASTPITFRQSLEGDGQVLWATGIPRGMRTWYAARVAHGDLPRDRDVQQAVVQLVATGTTDRLSSQPPIAAGARGALEPLAIEPLGLVPSEDQLLATAMGGAPWVPPTGAMRRPVRIWVANGHLKLAAHPVLVGHYIGDSLNGSELILDRAHQGRISRRRERGLHPGPLDNFDVHLADADGTQPPGAVVVGLGEVGELSAGTLQQTVRTGLVALASAMDERDDADRKAGAGARGSGARGVSCVLVGTGAGVLGITDSVVAILRAVREANQILGESRVAEIELIEWIEQRAIDAWHAVHGRLERGEFKDHFVLDEVIETKKGAWRRAGPDDDPSWWMPVTIQAEKGGGTADPASTTPGPAATPAAGTDGGTEDPASGLASAPDRGALHYMVIAGRARVEASLVATRRSVVDLYLRRITQRRVETGPDSAARTLFELLWPNRLKEHSLDDRNVRLILDESAAALPWEMMDDRRPWVLERNGGTSSDRGPPAVRHGVLRQLVSAHIRETARSTALRRKALVIGDPRGLPSGFPELPGAEKEARLIKELLDGPFKVTTLIGDKVMPEDVVSALFSDAWEIIHIAAHGVFKHRFEGDPTQELRTGIVLGGQPQPFILDCEMLKQLPIAPELFFVNCCSLGAIDPPAEQAFIREGRPALASSIAVQLIRTGTRAVVAAGWEVGDAPALRFAERFYRDLLAGERFGDVVKDARAEVHDAYPEDSTWGAYQCYGNPDFQLERLERLERPPNLATPREAISAIERMAAMGAVGGERDIAADLGELGLLQDKIAGKGWLDQADVRSALADAFAQLGDVDLAIEHYAAAAGIEKSSLSVRSIEQLLSLRVKRAQRRPKGNGPEAIDEIKAIIKQLQALIEACGPTLERYSLLGGAFKRLAYWQDGGKARTEALEQMIDAYREAQERGKARGVDNPYYPWSQAVMGSVILALRGGKPSRAGIAALRRSVLGQPAVGQPEVDDFWLHLLPTDLDLLELLGRGTLSEKAQDTIVQGYLDVWKVAGTQLKLSSVLEQLDFYQRMLGDLTTPPQAVIDGLGHIEHRLRSATTG